MPVDETLAGWKQSVDACLNRLLPASEAVPAQLHQAMRYAALAPGKRIRPLLAIASAVASGGSEDAALEAGCALELVHAFSLIHDDLPAIDDDDLRRGRPTCHVEFGEGLAILAGDALFALAFEIMARALPGTDAVRLLAEASGSYGLVGGEVLDLQSEGEPPNAEMVEVIHRRKTGALIAAACEIGGIAGGASKVVREKLRQFGASVGLAFQIQDDILNATSTPELLGKSAGSDLAKGKQTYPAVFGISASRESAASAIDDAMSRLIDMPGSVEPLMSLARSTVDRSS